MYQLSRQSGEWWGLSTALKLLFLQKGDFQQRLAQSLMWSLPYHHPLPSRQGAVRPSSGVPRGGPGPRGCDPCS